MRLVPRQLRKQGFPSSVPYYGGRMTPEVIQGLGKTPADDSTPDPTYGPQLPIPRAAAPASTQASLPPPAAQPPHALPAGTDDVRKRQLDDVRRLHDEGIISDGEFAMLLGRLAAHT